MSLRALQYLVAVADFQHFSRAAAHCCVSQPTLSMQLKKLEHQLGVQLIERRQHQVMLTQQGEKVLPYARDALNSWLQLQQVAKIDCDPFSGRLAIGIIPTVAPYLLPRIMPQLHQALPDLQIELVEQKTDTVLAQLKNGRLDAMIAATPIVAEGLKYQHLFDEHFLLAVSKRHRWARRKRIVSMTLQQELASENLLLLDDGHCLREQALVFCDLTSLQVAHNLRATSLEVLRHMVLQDVGITLIPSLAYRVDDGLHYIDVINPQPKREIALFWRASSNKQAVLDVIAQQILNADVQVTR